MSLRKTQSAGLTLVELLVAMVISLMVLGGVYQIFRETTRTYRIQEGLSRVQENGRFAMDFMMRDIRHAGYPGCVVKNISFENTLDNNSDHINAGIRGFDALPGGGWSPNIPSGADIRHPVSGSDIITVRGRIESSVPTSYFVRMNPRGQPALYRKIGDSRSEEVVTGVETMQFLYGVGDRYVDSYLRADKVTDWNRVRSVQVGLLMRSPDKIRGMEPNVAVYNVLDARIAPFNDRYLRRVFMATVALRNRLP